MRQPSDSAVTMSEVILFMGGGFWRVGMADGVYRKEEESCDRGSDAVGAPKVRDIPAQGIALGKMSTKN